MSSDETTGQIDVVIYRGDGLALPLGPSSIFFAESVVASIEVKSTLKRDEFKNQIVECFSMLPEPQPLKIIFAARLEGDSQHRKTIARWVSDFDLTEAQIPDLVIIMDNAPIVRGSTLRCLAEVPRLHGDSKFLYKLGDYHTQKWLGLLILVIELAHRASQANWSRYIHKRGDAGTCNAREATREGNAGTCNAWG